MWLAAAEPYLTAVATVDRLLAYTPGGFGDRQLRTLQGFVKSWRAQTAKLMIVRRLVGSGRFEGLEAAQVLARLYAAARLYVNFFQPSFNLKRPTGC